MLKHKHIEVLFDCMQMCTHIVCRLYLLGHLFVLRHSSFLPISEEHFTVDGSPKTIEQFTPGLLTLFAHACMVRILGFTYGRHIFLFDHYS